MDIAAYEKRITELERENRILKQKLSRSLAERQMIEEALETHSNALKVRNAELEESRKLILRSEAKYRDLAHHDILTGLPNRAFLYDQLIQHLLPDHMDFGALFYLDLDNFKFINDNYGHVTGDFVLCQAAERLLTCVRKDDIVARIGGDEFAILIPSTNEDSMLTSIAERIISEIAKPFSIDDKSFLLGISIGISLYPDDDDDPEKLLQKADTAMYCVKKSSLSSGYRLFRDICSPVLQ